MLEASAGFKRRMTDSLVGLTRWGDKYGSLMASRDAAEALSRHLEEVAYTYQQNLRDLLDAIPVDVIPIPDVDHDLLVRRAAERMPPCDAKGDGYRDSLNWFAILELVRDGETITFVTADTDFTDGSGLLHSQLRDEVSSVSKTCHVAVLDSVPSVALALASEFAEAEEDDVKALQGRLRQQTIVKYVRDVVLNNRTSLGLQPQSLALPLSASEPLIVDIGDALDSGLSVKAALEGSESAAELAFSAETTLLFAVAPGAELGEEFDEAVGPSGERLAQATKVLHFTALVTIDRFDQPSHAELISAKAPADDPGRAAWRRAATSALRQQLGLSPSTLEAIRNMGKFELPASTLDAIRNMGKFELPPSTLEAIRNMGKFELPASTLEAIRRMSRWSDTSRTRPPDSAESEEDGQADGNDDSNEADDGSSPDGA